MIATNNTQGNLLQHEKRAIQKVELSEEERERTKRQKLLQGWNQVTIKQSTVFIAGVGALGCEIAKDLALAGIGKLVLCDMDTIETSNLSRQMLFYKGDEGRFKAEVAAERLKRMNPFMETEVFTIPLQKIPMTKYMECQAVVAALDNVQARIDLNTFCLKLGIPLIEGGTVGFEGHVQVIIPETTKTLSGEPFPIGSVNRLIEGMVQEKKWALDDNTYPEYTQTLERIMQLEEEIEKLKSTYIEPVDKLLREQVEKELKESLSKDPENSAASKILHSSPCYRCVVPIPPPLANQLAACTLKGIPRTRQHCAVKGEVQFIKKYDRKPDYDNPADMKETLTYAQKELLGLRTRVLEESIPPEQMDSISPTELAEVTNNIFQTFGGDFALEDMENVLGNKIPAIQSVSSIISSIQSQEILKILFLMHDENVGPVMDPPYINYNGVYGLFDQLEVSRLDDCVACGSGQGQENLTIVVPDGATINDVFLAVQDYHPGIQSNNFIITNPLTKKFLYNPLFEQGKTGGKTLEEMEIHNYAEIVFTPMGRTESVQSSDSNQANEGILKIKQYNVTVQII
ncbi:MAG: ThiF family adenylyltransferase [Promethearchaeota archaeon]